MPFGITKNGYFGFVLMKPLCVTVLLLKVEKKILSEQFCEKEFRKKLKHHFSFISIWEDLPYVCFVVLIQNCIWKS